MTGTKRPRTSTSSALIDIRASKRSKSPDKPPKPTSMLVKVKNIFGSCELDNLSRLMRSYADILNVLVLGRPQASSSDSSFQSSLSSTSQRSPSDENEDQPASVLALLENDRKKAQLQITSSDVVDHTQDDDDVDGSSKAGPSRIPYSTTNIYPNLPAPITPNIFDEGSLKPSQNTSTDDNDSIDLGEVDSFELTSELPSTAPTSPISPLSPVQYKLPIRRVEPRRPILDVPTPSREYLWLNTSYTRAGSVRSTSSRSSSSSSRSRRNSRHKRSTNLRNERSSLAERQRHHERIKSKAVAVAGGDRKRVMRILDLYSQSPTEHISGRRHETAFHIKGMIACELHASANLPFVAKNASDTKAILASLLPSAPISIEFDVAIAKVGKPVPVSLACHSVY